MTKEHTTADLIAQARKWERGYGEGYWFNAMADEIERLDADAAGAQAELASVKACWAEALGNVATRNREIEQLRRERHQLRNELTAARLENQQRRALLVEVYNHGENSELHGRIGAALGAAPGEDASPVEPNPGHSNLCACPACLQERGREAIDNALKPAPEPNPAQPDPRWALIAELTKWAADWAVYRGPAEKPVDKGWRLAAEEVQSMIQKSSEKSNPARECQCATYCMAAAGMTWDPPVKCRGLTGKDPGAHLRYPRV